MISQPRFVAAFVRTREIRKLSPPPRSENAGNRHVSLAAMASSRTLTRCGCVFFKNALGRINKNNRMNYEGTHLHPLVSAHSNRKCLSLNPVRQVNPVQIRFLGLIASRSDASVADPSASAASDEGVTSTRCSAFPWSITHSSADWTASP